MISNELFWSAERILYNVFSTTLDTSFAILFVKLISSTHPCCFNSSPPTSNSFKQHIVAKADNSSSVIVSFGFEWYNQGHGGNKQHMLYLKRFYLKRFCRYPHVNGIYRTHQMQSFKNNKLKKSFLGFLDCGLWECLCTILDTITIQQILGTRTCGCGSTRIPTPLKQ